MPNPASSGPAPKVSVIVPNYNHARYLPARLDSILRQTFQDFELVILDDASTDGSAEVIAGYLGHPRTSFHPNRQNSGSPFAQWNKGVRLAKGEYVWIAESDDVAEPQLLEKLTALLDAHPRAAVAYCQSARIGPADEPQGTLADWTADLDAAHWASDFTNSGREECRRHLLWKNTLPNASAVVFRKKIYEQAGGAPEHMRLCGDWLTWARLLMLGDVAFTPECLNRYRKHPASVRETTAQNRFADENWAVQFWLARACGASAADWQKLGRRRMQELLRRVRSAPAAERTRVRLECLRAYAPFLLAAPVAATRCLLERNRIPLERASA